MGNENRGPFGVDELTPTLAITSAGSRSDHPTSRTSNFTGVKPPFGSALENWSRTPAFSGVAPSTRFSFWGPGTAASASRYSTPASASGGGNGATCGAAVELSDVGGREVSGDASSRSLAHPGSPSSAAIAAVLKIAVRRRGIQQPSVRRTHRLDQRHRRVVRKLPAALIDEPEVLGCRGQMRARRGDGGRGGTGTGGGDVADVERQRRAALGSGLLQFVVGQGGRNRDAALDQVTLVSERHARVLQRVQNGGELIGSGQVHSDRRRRVQRLGVPPACGGRRAEDDRLNAGRHSGNGCNARHTGGRSTDGGQRRHACG